ncbi:aspartyl/asparaginyl beta-hydroxylase domain-containing protein [Actinocrispum wychmicini]|uniref:Aspartyl/asparaginyl beta-hydroxylase n=1 Tax=Actinocrispum wychmicini TaxID=1213861 RepID=A0A4R2J8K3_9PSEU|nr:aspartyl/asparaginyl beta-hydroxylase domain-containing protein [Actinocrispum wychmicini]TCO55603.1 aspartyl/asparaginyl beta-hydroxylase [Actinocrispum wychmicini]
MICARLPRDYDPELLRRDLDSLRALPQAPQPGPYHDGDWTGLELYAQLPDRLHHFGPTPALDHAPYLARILAELDCPKLLVRLLTLPPGSDIGEHNDAGSNFQFGSLRLHVPIVTHPDVIMVIDGERVFWQPGELWWGDFSRRHWLRNDSDVTRVHMVIDVQINDFVLGLFPPELVAEKRQTGISTHRPLVAEAERTDTTLAPFACDFTLPATLMPLFGHGTSLQELARDGVAQCHPENGRLVVTLDGARAFAMERVGERSFSIIGQPPGIEVEFSSADDPEKAEVIVRGVPEDLYAAQLGFQQGPIIPEQRFPLKLNR